MRLIDADKINFNEVFKGQSDFANDIRETAQNFISIQPTVYDVDKVVEQIGNISELARPVGWTTKTEIVRTKDVIEIIKAGGEDE